MIEHTIRAALEIDWPADKLTVLLLDDGGSPGGFSRGSSSTFRLLSSDDPIPPTYVCRGGPAGGEAAGGAAGDAAHGAAADAALRGQVRAWMDGWMNGWLFMGRSTVPPPPPLAHHDHTAITHHPFRIRKPGQPHHAKAGNLNHALFQAAPPASSGEYLLVLDCDMAPKADILQALLPHCLDVHRAWDPSVALVQSPQAFSNLEPGDPLNNASPVSRGVFARVGLAFCTETAPHPRHISPPPPPPPLHPTPHSSSTTSFSPDGTASAPPRAAGPTPC